MNKNAIGLHKFSRIFYEGDDAVRFLCTPRADCNFPMVGVLPVVALCLHTLRADCNGAFPTGGGFIAAFASTRPVQIATVNMWQLAKVFLLCLHTPRADCNAFRSR